MPLTLLSNGLLAAAIAVFVIARQLLPRHVRFQSMLGIPLIACVIGLGGLSQSPPMGAAAVALLVVELGAGMVTGLLRGASVKLWRDADGDWMSRGTLFTLCLWAVSIALRLGLAAAGHESIQSLPVSELALFLGTTLAAQYLVVWARISTSAPERLVARSR